MRNPVYSRAHRRRHGSLRGAGRNDLQGSELAHHLVDVLADRMAADIVLLDLTSLSAFADFFVIATVDNVRQMRAVVDAVDDDLRSLGIWRRNEGTLGGGWMLIEADGVVVHLFSPDQRVFYDIEGLWSRATEVVRVQ